MWNKKKNVKDTFFYREILQWQMQLKETRVEETWTLEIDERKLEAFELNLVLKENEKYPLGNEDTRQGHVHDKKRLTTNTKNSRK